MEGGQRLQKVLARAGVASRRKAEELIRAGRVTVNGRVAALGDVADPGDDVRLDGRPLPRPERSVTYLLHKPRGLVTTASDELGRPTVMDLVPAVPGLHPVGRLDLDSEGLLLLTTDGDLTLRLTHPRYRHEKEYRVWTDPPDVSDEALARLTSGVTLEDGPARAERAERAPGGAVVVLREGRKRQVRRMLAAVGHEVVRLKRTRVAGLELGDLPVGRFRELTAAETAALASGDPLV
ncbi:MAG TPA: pseudouridine synthase [Trueperaceae bacterium]|nr:pseudouridine synthase [Trueperaceae bacterium]